MRFCLKLLIEIKLDSVSFLLEELSPKKQIYFVLLHRAGI